MHAKPLFSVLAKPAFERIAFVTRPLDPALIAFKETLTAWLAARGKETSLEWVLGSNESIPSEAPDLVIALGGDGTVLAAARFAARWGVPLLGVNLGTLGFLAESGASDVFATLERVFAGEYLIEEHRMLRVEVFRRGERTAESIVLNDVVVSRGQPRSISLEVMLDRRFLFPIHGDGIVLATPAGSTAYALAAGGPIVNPSVDALVLAPICAHAFTLKPMVIPRHTRVEMIARGEDVLGVTFDGQHGANLAPGDRIEVNASDRVAQMIRMPDSSYYQLLAGKLGFARGV
jgi:NAD+ kinase